MLLEYPNIKDEFDNKEKKFSNELENFSEVIDEIRDHTGWLLEDIKNVNVLIHDIDKQFSEKTGIVSAKDMAFLWARCNAMCKMGFNPGI